MHDEKRTFSFPSADRIHTLRAVTWYPTQQPCRAIIQVSHGMTEYFERYEEFAHAMTRHGFAVSGHDHLGHKTSVNSNSELGCFAEKDGWKLVIDDLNPYFGTGKNISQYPPFSVGALHGFVHCPLLPGPVQRTAGRRDHRGNRRA